MLKSFIAAMLALAVAASAWAGPTEDKALIEAAFSLDFEGLKAALAKGADPNAKKSEPSPSGHAYSMPVLLSVNFGGEYLYRKLRAAGSSSDEANVQIKGLKVALAKALFDAGAKLDRLEDFSRQSLFETAIETGNLALVALLIDHGASVTAEVSVYTPTQLAKIYDREAVYQLLIARGGTPVNSKSAAQLALNGAAISGDISAMERAIKNGAGMNYLGPGDEQTALNVAVGLPLWQRKRAAAIWWLLDHGADPNESDGVILRLRRLTVS